MIYLDNAATSWPKPPEVLKAMVDALEHSGGNPGRSGHRLSIEAARIVYDTRETVASFFSLRDPLRVIFTNNATHAINIVIHGLLKPGDSVVVSSMEHNAVMRPLRVLEKQGVRLSILPCFPDGNLNLDEAAKVINAQTRLVVMIHASNVTGTVLPVTEIAQMAHRMGALVLVDAAQTAGILPLDMEAVEADFIAFTGHKGLQGPPGIGGLLISPGFDTHQLCSLMQGGTGSQSEQEEQPEFVPDKFESGTINLAGIAGLRAGIHWIEDRGVDEINAHERELIRMLIDGLSQMSDVRLYGTLDPGHSTAIVSFTAAGKTVSEIGFKLDEEHAILTRVGLHCAPAAHRTIGSFPGGTVRLAPGVFTTKGDIKVTLSALQGILSS
jgi:cysteine desulfurase family protein